MALKRPKSLAQFEAGSIENPKIDMQLPAESIDELVVNLTTVGTLAIFFDATDDARLIIDGDDALLPHDIDLDGTRLIIEGRNLHTETVNARQQRLVIEVHVRTVTRINVDFTAGMVILDGGTGDVDIRGQFGEIAGVTFARQVNVHMNCGAVTLNELAGNADIHLSMGGVTLGWTELSGREQISVDCGMGGVDLLLPPGAAPRQDRGGFFRETRVRTAAGSTFNAKVGMGGLEVHDWSR